MLRLNFNFVSTVREARHITIFFYSLMQTTHKIKMKILLLVAKNVLGFWSIWMSFTLGILENFFREAASLLFSASL